MNLERLSTAATTAWVITLCLVVVSTGVLFTLPYDVAPWSCILWASIGGMWIAVVAGIVLQRKLVSRVRAESRASH